MVSSVCVKRKGEEESHRAAKSTDASCEARMCFDYKSFGQEGSYDDKATALIINDEKTKINFAHICDKKVPSDDWVVEQTIEDIARLGCAEVVLKDDGSQRCKMCCMR